MWRSGKLTGALRLRASARRGFVSCRPRVYRCLDGNKRTVLHHQRFPVVSLDLQQQCSEILHGCQAGQFVQFLQTKDPRRYRYSVSMLDGAVAACHDLELDATSRRASFVCGMVDRASHERCVETAMTRDRTKIAKGTPNIAEVVLSTSQHTHGFYARHGFVVTKVTTNGFGPGQDCYDMRLTIG